MIGEKANADKHKYRKNQANILVLKSSCLYDIRYSVPETHSDPDPSL